MLTWMWHPLGLSSWPSEAMLKTEPARSTKLPPLVNEGQNSSNNSGSRLGLRSQEGDHDREPFNYIGQGEKTLMFSTQPLQLFMQPLVFCKMKGRLFLVFAEFANTGRAPALCLPLSHQLNISLTNPCEAAASYFHLSSSSSLSLPANPWLCKWSSHIADRKFLLV